MAGYRRIVPGLLSLDGERQDRGARKPIIGSRSTVSPYLRTCRREGNSTLADRLLMNLHRKPAIEVRITSPKLSPPNALIGTPVEHPTLDSR
jgi:hypothetical protein